MPQASNALRGLMAKWFPTGADGNLNTNGIDDGAPAQFLLAHGYTERSGMWRKPTQAHTPSIYEEACLMFLRDEWDHDFVKPLYPYVDYNTGGMYD